ncbi:MAG: division/cell wall cluster transcriptional repressor MraZ [Treponema sp.]|jgi:MraZ protein|nr:division/cell wall cluster transcriptional repressor MraZ [Treponema sp.]
MFGGEYSVTFDDTCRISLPRRLRDALGTDKVVLTKGEDRCLWLFTPEHWKEKEITIVSSTNPFSAQGRYITRHFIGPKQELDIDRQGRILVPPSLRDFAGLSKECVVLGQPNYIEIWDKDRYEAYLAASEDDFSAASEELGARIMKDRNLGGYGNNPHSGTAGADSAVSRPKGQA